MLHFTTFHNVSIYVQWPQKLVIWQSYDSVAFFLLWTQLPLIPITFLCFTDRSISLSPWHFRFRYHHFRFCNTTSGSEPLLPARWTTINLSYIFCVSQMAASLRLPILPVPVRPLPVRRTSSARGVRRPDPSCSPWRRRRWRRRSAASTASRSAGAPASRRTRSATGANTSGTPSTTSTSRYITNMSVCLSVDLSVDLSVCL